MIDLSHALGDRILVIAPHADDEVLGCGGLISRMVDENKNCQIRVVCAAVGPMQFQHGTIVTADERRAEFKKSCGILGVHSNTIWSSSHDAKLDTVSKCDFISYLDMECHTFRPDTILLPYPSVHQDHQFVFDCGMAMCRPSPSKSVGLVMMYEYPISGWNYHPIQGGTIFIDITKYMPNKLKAMSAHVSQIREPPHLFSLESIEIWGSMRARECGLSGYAEMFKLLRRVI